MYIYNKLRTDCIVLHVSPKLMIVRIQLCDAEQRASLQIGHVPYRPTGLIHTSYGCQSR